MTIAALIIAINLLTAQITEIRAQLPEEYYSQVDWTPYEAALNLQ